ncbi:MAG: helix-turn-helix domain-containing protein, partial [candidate division WOR-3 bacterium]
ESRILDDTNMYHFRLMTKEKDRFRITPELGQRLRELRLKAGLTQQQVAVLMGRKGKGGHSIVGRLEAGRVPSPSAISGT